MKLKTPGQMGYEARRCCLGVKGDRWEVLFRLLSRNVTAQI